MAENTMYLSSWSLIEPDDKFYFYQPTWLNAWEAYLYKRGLKKSHARGWGIKRFGIDLTTYEPERIRNPQYMPYLEAIDQSASEALQRLTTKERIKLIKSRTALIYVDSWGESGLLERNSSSLHTSMIDTLPKNLLKKFSIKEPTCKIRGEKQAFAQALQMAEDYLSWDIFDNIVICAAYRAIPIFVFSEKDIPSKSIRREFTASSDVNLSVERAGCFILSQNQSEIKIKCGNYSTGEKTGSLLADSSRIDLLVVNESRQFNALSPVKPESEFIDLVELYGESGCLTPALSIDYFAKRNRPDEKMRTIVFDNFSGYQYFDIEYNKG